MLAKNKKLTLGVIFLMLVVLFVQLVNLLGENGESDNDKFMFTGAYFTLETKNPAELKKFYFDNLNFYPLELKGDFIGSDAVRIKIVKSENPRPTKITLRVNHLSRLFRKLIKNKIDFIEPKHLDANDFLVFKIEDTAGNLITVVEE